MQRRRTPQQIREDLKTIMRNSDAATSLSELATLSKLTYAQLITTLSKFPSARRAITEKLNNNRIQKDYQLGYVIDTSMIQVSGQVIDRIVEANNIIICLKSTIDELDAINKTGKDLKGKNAHALIDRVLYDKEHFSVIDYRKPRYTKPDDVIVAYCEENKDRVILFTADKNMALKAKAVGVLVQYFTPSGKLIPSAKRLENGEVVIDTRGEKSQIIRVISRLGNVYENVNRLIPLNTGDQVYIASRVKSHIHLDHYEILDDNGGYNIVFKKNFGFAPREIKRLPPIYKTFVEEFKRRHDKKYVR